MKIDLNFPPFQRDLFSLNKTELSAFIRTARKIAKMDFMQIQRSSGFNLEKIRHMTSPAGETLYSIRVSKSFRAVVTIENDFLRFVSLHPDHDSSYKKLQ